MKGVVLLNLGGPDGLNAVRPFLYNLFSDREIIPLGPALLQRPLAWLIAALRSRKTKRAYELIGGRSPILEETLRQAEALERALSEDGPYRVYVGMRYWRPYIQETLLRASEEGIEEAIGLPLYPQYSRTTSGSSLRSFERACERLGIPHKSIHQWYDHPLYIQAVVERIKEKVKEVDFILFSAHSLPVRFIEEGDPYLKQTESTVKMVMDLLSREGHDLPFRLSFQSRSGPLKWLGPSTDEVIEELAGRKVQSVLVVPISFVSDHIETLYEIDILYRKMAEERGMRLKRTASLDASSLFISALRDLVLKTSQP